MTATPRRLLAALAALAFTAAACGEDGPDFTDDAERAAELAAEFRAGGSTTTQPPAAAPTGSDAAAAEATPVTESPAPTVPMVEPTGVVEPVIALDNSFRQQVIEISVGDEVVWENRGLNEHNALPVGGGDWGVETEHFQPGAVYAHVFTVPGEYDYFCSIHGNETVGMVGTVIVKG